MIIREVKCSSILTKSGISGIDYALNPYTGCEHGCLYCYAVFMKKFTGHNEGWGRFVDVKINAPEVLRKQLKKTKPGLVSLSTVTDPYQPIEEKYCITRQCLEILIDYKFPVSILTKSKLVLRDIDILKKLKNVDVGFSIAFTDEKVRRIFEPRSSTTEERFYVLKELAQQNITTWLFFSPVLPYFSDTEINIDILFRKAAEAGVESIFVDTLQLYPKVWERLKKILNMFSPDVVGLYRNYGINKNIYKKGLKEKIKRIAKNYNMPVEFTF
ncbi:MAG: hypothetical protein B5M53_04170 [Candidatus Cloacimonas sp. 4484_209]|nr:MAG: hypothetical protein B5M53_04170 [Candidatus Cloacimonas sp. 4484_209]